jgi:hypothetical protein
MQTRQEAFDLLIQHIAFAEWTTTTFRQYKVSEWRRRVELVYPFLTDTEKLRADVWLESEQHLELWDEEYRL